MTEYTSEQLEQLKMRWVGHRDALRNLIPLIKKDKNWYRSETYELLVHAMGPLPAGVPSVEIDLRGALLDEADLAGADLRYADLSGATLVETDLSGAQLTETYLCQAHLWQAKLEKADLWEADLSGADLRYAKLMGANLAEADLSGANLWQADLSGANCEKTILAGANLEEVMYTTDGAYNRLRHWWWPRLMAPLPLIGRRVRPPVGITSFELSDITQIDFSKNAFLKQYIEDYQFIQALKKRAWGFRWLIYPLWKVTSDCGRSLSLWILWAVLCILAFALVYATADLLSPSLRASLDWAVPQLQLDPQKYHHGILTFFFFSLATFTTSGFYGDVQLHNSAALFWTSLEVVLGYLMLGGLISIFANKLARRA